MELEDRWPFLGHFWAPSFQASVKKSCCRGSLAEPLAEASGALAGVWRHVTHIQDGKPLPTWTSKKHVPLSSPYLSPLSNKPNTNPGIPSSLDPTDPRGHSPVWQGDYGSVSYTSGSTSWYNHLGGRGTGNMHQKHVLCSFLDICAEETLIVEPKIHLWGY